MTTLRRGNLVRTIQADQPCILANGNAGRVGEAQDGDEIAVWMDEDKWTVRYPKTIRLTFEVTGIEEALDTFEAQMTSLGRSIDGTSVAVTKDGPK